MSDERFEFDFNRITYREILELNIDDEDDKKAGDDTLELIVRVLVKWPQDGDCTVDAIKDLGLQDFADLQSAFSDAMSSVFTKSD